MVLFQETPVPTGALFHHYHLKRGQPIVITVLLQQMPAKGALCEEITPMGPVRGQGQTTCMVFRLGDSLFNLNTSLVC